MKILILKPLALAGILWSILKNNNGHWSYWRYSFLILTFCFPFMTEAQRVPKALQEDNREIREITSRVDQSGWLFFNSKIALQPGDLFTKYKEAMGLGRDDEMVRVSEVTDRYGLTHVKYQQKHKGIPVDDGEYIVHLEDCIEFLASGKIVEGLDLPSKPGISKDQAFELALAATGARTFAWQNREMEAELKEDEENPNATYLPEAELLIAKSQNPESRDQNYHLVFRYLVTTDEPFHVYQVDVDAVNGAVVNMFDTVVECFGNHHTHSASCQHHDHSSGSSPVPAFDFFANGTAPLIYYGTQTIQTKKRGWPNNDYILKDQTRGSGIHTKKYGSWGNRDDGNNIWPLSEGPYTQAHWTCARSWDYFKNVHGLNGTNGSGKKVKVRSNWNNQNATYSNGWFSQTISIGKSSGNHLSTMDIMAHEYTHGVTRHSANLKYQGESGALNESFSDIFGTMVEDWTNAGSFDWTLGEDASWTIRSMSNPPSYGDPDTYEGTNWADPNDSWDNGGVHVNSGVQNKWFYLLSQGGTHNGETVQGIGRTKAAKIAYRNLTTYLGKNSQYSDARIGGIRSAVDLYGKCSFEEIQTTNAWAAVGLGEEFEGDCVKIKGPYYVCVYGFNMLPVTFRATGLPGSNFTWSQIPSNWNYSIYGTGNKYLKLNSVSIPASALPQTVNIKVTSSQGGSDTHYVTLEDCRFDPCDGLIEK